MLGSGGIPALGVSQCQAPEALEVRGFRFRVYLETEITRPGSSRMLHSYNVFRAYLKPAIDYMRHLRLSCLTWWAATAKNAGSEQGSLGRPMFHELLGPIQLDCSDNSEGAEFEERTGVHHRLADAVCRYSSTV